jgi:UDP-glucose 4-epimerase
LSGLRTIVLRYFSIYGPGLRKQVIWDIVRRIRAGERRIELFGTGRETRDFLHVEDAVDLLHLVISRATEPHTIVNGGSVTATTVAEIAMIISGALSSDVSITFNGQERAGDPQHFQACTTKAASLGFRPRMSLREGLPQYKSAACAENVEADVAR